MDIKDIFPETPVFTLQNSGKMYELRLVNLEDTIWVRANIGDEKAVMKMIRELDWHYIVKFVYRLLKDKSDFMAGEATEINDDGVEFIRKLTGPDKLLKAISGQEEGTHLLGALVTSISLSNPMVAKMVKDETQKKTLEELTGQKSLTQSVANTDGPSIKSQPLQ